MGRESARVLINYFAFNNLKIAWPVVQPGPQYATVGKVTKIHES